MRYLSFRTNTGYESVGAIVGDHIFDLAPDPVAETTDHSPIRRLLRACNGQLSASPEDVAGRPGFARQDVRVMPLVPDPTKIVAAPVNYVDHQAEMNVAAHIDALGVFLKAPSSVIATGGTVELPYSDRRFDQEGELALVVGRTARNIAAADVDTYIAGYTCLLDMTMRGGEDRSVRKSFDTFTPVGPYLVTPDEVGPLDQLRLQTWVNGELRQDADIADLIWGIPDLLAYISSVMTLHPGDIVTTGTPAGVGRVEPGDTIAVEISRVGRLEAKVQASHAAQCPTQGAHSGPKPPAEVTPVRRR